MKNKFLLVATLLLAQLGAMASSITYNGSINLDFTDLPMVLIPYIEQKVDLLTLCK